VLEGYLPIIYKFSHIQPSAVWGAIFNLAKNGIALVNTAPHKETAEFLYVAARQEQIVEKRSPAVHAFKKYEKLSDAQVYFVASLPNSLKPLIAYANVEGENAAKFSSRTTEAALAKGVNLGDAMRIASEKNGGKGGGHNIAAGAQVTLDQIDNFERKECVKPGHNEYPPTSPERIQPFLGRRAYPLPSHVLLSFF
jgi:hypothetical protein